MCLDSPRCHNLKIPYLKKSLFFGAMGRSTKKKFRNAPPSPPLLVPSGASVRGTKPRELP